MLLFPKKISNQSKEILDVIDALTVRMVETKVVIKIYLFGSWVNNSFTEASDLDFAVLVKNPSDIKLFYERFSKIDIEWPVDILVFSAEQFKNKAKVGGVCSIILEEGKVIYHRTT